ncbi:MAG: ABC transporter ATP-binding protein [Planctomycetia bacterium]|nr:ABC transporter ATP-binding protein [Planctomycetia bacterium]
MATLENTVPDLIVDHVAKEYPTRGEPLVVLRDISLALSAGENVAILGPSGCGKSTLLHLIGTLDEPTSGTITLRGDNPFSMSEPQLARFRNRNIGFVFQDHHLLPQLSVLENVLVPTLAEGSPNDEQIERARDLIGRVGLAERIEHRPAELSGGERQRVAAARALIQNPILLLADEPTGSLDRTNALALGNLLLELQQQENTMLIVVTHSVELATHMSRRLELDDGSLAECG